MGTKHVSKTNDQLSIRQFFWFQALNARLFIYIQSPMDGTLLMVNFILTSLLGGKGGVLAIDGCCYLSKRSYG